jgi:hypothetical protein
MGSCRDGRLDLIYYRDPCLKEGRSRCAGPERMLVFGFLGDIEIRGAICRNDRQTTANKKNDYSVVPTDAFSTNA